MPADADGDGKGRVEYAAKGDGAEHEHVGEGEEDARDIDFSLSGGHFGFEHGGDLLLIVFAEYGVYRLLGDELLVEVFGGIHWEGYFCWCS